jgi:hypothetical protein
MDPMSQSGRDEWPKVFAARCFKRVPAFEFTTCAPIALAPGEEMLGIYRNVANALTDAIVVTNVAIRVKRSSEWQSISYREVSEIELPGEEKRSVRSVLTTLSSGAVVELPVRGGGSRFSDAYEFFRFLRSCVDSSSAKQ